MILRIHVAARLQLPAVWLQRASYAAEMSSRRVVAAGSAPGVANDADLRFRLSPAFAVEQGGATVDEADLGSRKARLLLKLLAARRGHLVPMDDIIEVLWAESPPAKAEANVATLVSRLRAVLGVEVIQGGRTGYRLGLGPHAVLDVVEAERVVEEAERRLAGDQPALAVTAATVAVDTLGPGVLEDEPGAEWALDVVRDVERLLRRARAAAWQAHLELGDHRRALAQASAAVDADSLDEAAHRAVILAHHRLGEQGEALRAYERLRRTLVEELGADPAPETTALYEAVLRGEPVASARAPVEGSVTSGDFVGRDAELTSLLERWSRAARGDPACVVLLGEAGIGKTRLAAELGRNVQAAGAIVLRARCYEAERSLLLQPFVEVVRAALATVPPDVLRGALGDRASALVALVPELSSLVGPVPEPVVAPASELERRRTFEAVAHFLAALGRARPVLLVLDDLHLAGASTVELLHFAIRWEAQAPLMVVATVRTEDADAVNEQLATVADFVEVTALTADDVRSLAEQAGLQDRAEAILTMTGGHTLFVVEALRALVEATDDEPAAGISIPPSLRDAITARAHRCGADVEELLRAGVVIGSSFEVTLLAELIGLSEEEVIRRLEPARRAGLLVEVGAGYELSNDLVREVLYETTPKPLRVVRHRRLATLLEERPEAAAHHAHAAGDVALAVAYWQRAAARAAATLASRETEELLTLAIEALGQADEATSAALLLARGRARLAMGSYVPASQDLSAAEQLAVGIGDRALASDALTERAWTAYHTRDMVQAGALAEEAAARPEAGPRAAILLGRVRNARGNLQGSLAILRGVSEEAPDDADRAYALSCLGTALAHSDRYDDALPVLERAAAECRRTGVLRGLLNARMFGAIVLANLGRFGAALTWAEQLASDARRYDAGYYSPRALNILALVWRELGEPGRAHDLAAEALETSRTTLGEVEGEPAANAMLALAESAFCEGDLATMAGHLDGITPLLSERVGFAWRIELRRLELQARLDTAKADELLIRAQESGSAKYEALALAALGATDEAVATARRSGSGWLLAKVAPEPVARRSAEQLAAELPRELRPKFMERGVLLSRFRN